MPTEPTAKPITINLDRNLGLALRQYKKATKLTHAEVVYRALICYWAAQGTKAGADALAAADDIGWVRINPDLIRRHMIPEDGTK